MANGRTGRREVEDVPEGLEEILEHGQRRTFTNVEEALRYIAGFGIKLDSNTADNLGRTGKGAKLQAHLPPPYSVIFHDNTIKTLDDGAAVLELASLISETPKSNTKYFAPRAQQGAFKQSGAAQRAIENYYQRGGEDTWDFNLNTGLYTLVPEGFDAAAFDEEEGDAFEQAGLRQYTEAELLNVLFSKEKPTTADERTAAADTLIATTPGLAEAIAMAEEIGYTVVIEDDGTITATDSEGDLEYDLDPVGFVEWSKLQSSMPSLLPEHLQDLWFEPWFRELVTEFNPDTGEREFKMSLLRDYEQTYGILAPRGGEVVTPRSWEEEIDFILAEALRTGGKIDEETITRILHLDSIRDQISAKRMTPERAFQLAAPIMQNPQHLSEMMSALLGGTGQQLSQDEHRAATEKHGGQTQDPLGADEPEGDIGTQPTAPVTAATQQRNQLASQLRQAGFSEPEILSGVADRVLQIPDAAWQQPMTPPEIATGAAGRVLQPEEYFPPGVAGRDTADRVAPVPAAQGKNTLAQLITSMNFTPEQWVGMDSNQRTAAVGMEIAELQNPTGGLAEYLRNPQQYRAQATETLNALSSPLSEQTTQNIGSSATLPAGVYGSQFSRTEEQENHLKELRFRVEESVKRGFEPPSSVARQIRQLNRLSPYNPKDSLRGTSNALQSSLGYGGQEAAFGGTPFFPVHKGLDPRGAFQQIGTQEWNKAQQQRFKARPVQRTMFG
jgi:hypothetical protein